MTQLTKASKRSAIAALKVMRGLLGEMPDIDAALIELSALPDEDAPSDEFQYIGNDPVAVVRIWDGTPVAAVGTAGDAWEESLIERITKRVLARLEGEL